MRIDVFSFAYFMSIFICVGAIVGLYFILRRTSDKTKKIVLFILLAIGLIWHFMKMFYPPYSTNKDTLYKNIWFVNICGANLFFFPFIFLSKSDKAKDYMFYMGVLSGIVSLLYPLEVTRVADQSAIWIDIIRFYYHHTIILGVPLLMVLLGLHKLSYKRVWAVPFYAIGIAMFIMVNQVLQSELGFISLRGDNILTINYPNHSMIWAPFNEVWSLPFQALCPSYFKKIPVGAHAGEAKYWPLIWLIVPVFVYFVPIMFLVSLIFDHKNFINDCKKAIQYIKSKRHKKTVDTQEAEKGE